MKTQNTFIGLSLLITAFSFGQNTFTNTGTSVGIGTTLPGSKLEVVEATDSKPAGVVAPTKSIFKMSRAGTPNFSYPENAEFRIGHGGPTVYGTKLDLYLNGGANTNGVPDQHVMTWNYDGKVGIGTTTPTANLDIKGSTADKGVSFGLTDDSGLSRFRFSASTFMDAPVYMNIMNFSGANCLSFSCNGGGTSLNISNPTSNAGISVGNDIYLNSSSYNKFNMYVTGKSRITSDTFLDGRVLLTGAPPANVTVGSSTIPTFPVALGGLSVANYKLFVKGGILTEEVRIALASTWADYVFKKEYKLPTLQEVEKQIQDKGHLFNVPSAEEIKANGVELGEMSKIQQEKIEELTLYIIQQNKINDGQAKLLEAQAKQLKLVTARLARLEKK
jgi:hypothetical protein